MHTWSADQSQSGDGKKYYSIRYRLRPAWKVRGRHIIIQSSVYNMHSIVICTAGFRADQMGDIFETMVFDLRICTPQFL